MKLARRNSKAPTGRVVAANSTLTRIRAAMSNLLPLVVGVCIGLALLAVLEVSQ